MKKVNRSGIQSEYSKLINGYERFFPAVYEPHGYMTECNFGGLQITLSTDGEACIVVRDWACDFVMMSDILDIEWIDDTENSEDSEGCQAAFRLEDEIYYLNDFMRI